MILFLTYDQRNTLKKDDRILIEEYDDIDEPVQVSEESLKDQPRLVSVTCFFLTKFDFLIIVNSTLVRPYQSEYLETERVRVHSITTK